MKMIHYQMKKKSIIENLEFLNNQIYLIFGNMKYMIYQMIKIEIRL